MTTFTTCFLIDDDPEDQEIFEMALSELPLPIQCIFANSALEGLEKLLNPAIDVPQYIFLDINMPRMDGLECLAEMRKHEQLRGIPVVMYSTANNPRFVEEAKRLGAVEYMVKPPTLPILVQRLARFFEQQAEYSSSS